MKATAPRGLRAEQLLERRRFSGNDLETSFASSEMRAARTRSSDRLANRCAYSRIVTPQPLAVMQIASASFSRERPPCVDQPAHVVHARSLVVQVEAQRAAASSARRLDQRNPEPVEHCARRPR